MSDSGCAKIRTGTVKALLRNPTYVHLGRYDKDIPAEAVAAKLGRHATVETFIYPAGHGFNSDRRADYDAPSARKALDRTLALFTPQNH
jgi:carboxymethylenebutenolidase